MRIAVFGTGAAAGHLGGRLAHAGESVAFIARGRTLEALRERGLRVESSRKGSFVIQPCEAAGDPAEVGPVDAVIVGVKAWQVAEAAKAMGPLLREDTCVVPIQNGLEAPVLLEAALGPGHAVGGLCGIASEMVEPGRINHYGEEMYIEFGELDNRPSPRLERLRDAFLHAGVRSEVASDIQAAMWRKLMTVASQGMVGAVTRVSLGEWRQVPETRRLVQQVMGETLAVARARGVSLADDLPDTIMAIYDKRPPGFTPSMQRDLLEGRPSELDAQVGAVIRLGRAAGVPVPAHEFIYASLLPSELRARGELTA